MGPFKQQKGMRQQLTEALVSALTEAAKGQAQPQPEPKGKRLSGLRSVAVGAALVTTGRGLAKLRGRHEPGPPQDDVVDEEEYDDEPVAEEEYDDEAPVDEEGEEEDSHPRARVRWLENG